MQVKRAIRLPRVAAHYFRPLSGALAGLLVAPILSRPPSSFASLPPELDVPLPLGFDPVVVVVARRPLLAEPAAGSPVVVPAVAAFPVSPPGVAEPPAPCCAAAA